MFIDHRLNIAKISIISTLIYDLIESQSKSYQAILHISIKYYLHLCER